MPGPCRNKLEKRPKNHLLPPCGVYTLFPHSQKQAGKVLGSARFARYEIKSAARRLLRMKGSYDDVVPAELAGSGGEGTGGRLFWASFLTLIAAGVGFSVRGAILADWSAQFGFTQGELGGITGGGLIGFGLTIIVFSFFADLVGYGRLMVIAFLLHVASVVVTLAAAPVYASLGKDATYQCLYWGAFLFSLANGTCEAVINPLTAT